MEATMNNYTSPEWAEKLRKAGFPQKELQVGDKAYNGRIVGTVISTTHKFLVLFKNGQEELRVAYPRDRDDLLRLPSFGELWESLPDVILDSGRNYNKVIIAGAFSDVNAAGYVCLEDSLWIVTHRKATPCDALAALLLWKEGRE